jgi:hypothetical protein
MRPALFRLASGASLALALALGGSPSLAAEVCLSSPYDAEMGEISELADRLADTLASFPSLARAFAEQAPVLCLGDTLYQEQGYYEPKTNRIVLRDDLDPDFQLAILVHEIRHLDQFDRDICPTPAVTLSDYIRSRLALEADAAAIGIYVAWKLREAGSAGPWDRLKTWLTHDDLVARFEAEIAAGGSDVAATAATYAQWFEDSERREIYTFAICSNYLDALDRDNLNPGVETLPDDFGARLCLMPDGRPYDCVLPP